MSPTTDHNFRYPALTDTPNVPRDIQALAVDIAAYIDVHPGPQGIQGTTGIQGFTGLQGIQGNQGTIGSQGTNGLQGTTGLQGFNGFQGIQGSIGSQGTTGTQGIQGRQGTNGTQGVQGLQGGGFNQLQGTQGIQGQAGSVQGTQGTQGIIPANLAYTNTDNTFTGKLYSSSSYSAIDISGEAASGNVSFMPNEVWFDRLRFQNGVFESSTNGTAWTNTTFNSIPFDGRNYTGLTIPALTYYRWTFSNLNFNYMLNKWLRISCTYNGSNPAYNLTFESSANGSTWTSRGTWSSVASSVSRRIFGTNDIGSDGYVRITIQNTHATATIGLANIELLSSRAGDQGGDTTGIEGNLPFDWDGSRAVTIQSKSSASIPLTIKPRPTFSSAVSSATASGTAITYNFSVSSFYPPMAGETVTVTGATPSTFNVTNATITAATSTSITVASAITDTYTSGATLKVTGTQNLLQWYNSDGYLLGYINSGGQLNITNNSSAGMNITGTASLIPSSGSLPAIRMQQASGQSTDILEFRNAAYTTVLGSIGFDGSLKFPTAVLNGKDIELMTIMGAF